MAPIKIHGAAISTATQRALVAVYEKDLDLEFVVVKMSEKEHLSENFRKLNPFGQVPVAQIGDLTLFESRAITQHLAHTNPDKGTELLSPGPAMSILGVWMEVEAHQFDPSAAKLCFELFYKNLFGMTADSAAVEELEGKLCKVLDVYEKRLADSKYLAGDCFTLADLHHLPCLEKLMHTQCKRLFEARPRVLAWATDILARPAWLKVKDMKS